MVDVAWEASGAEFRTDESFADGDGGEVRVVESVKLTNVSGTVCGEAIDTVEDESAVMIVEEGYCRGFSEEDCEVFGDDVPSAPEL
ncbi:MAG: hypothetical protein IIC95_02365 [Chloroflexi bacterium]|nr:hypothetical protein [Chloroflexota bacterium]